MATIAKLITEMNSAGRKVLQPAINYTKNRKKTQRPLRLGPFSRDNQKQVSIERLENSTAVYLKKPRETTKNVFYTNTAAAS